MTQDTAQPPAEDAVPWPSLMILGSASFASSAALRFCDPLLPKLANAFSTTPGAAAIVVTTYSVAYGGFQLVTGPLGDRYGKVRMVSLGAVFCGLFTIACAFASTLDQIAILRLLAGLTGAAIIPNCLAFIGDTIPASQRQAVLARYMIFMSAGAVSGQAIGGIIADAFGWHAVFLMVGAFLVIAGTVLTLQLRTNPVLSKRSALPQGGLAGSFRQIAGSGRTPLGRLVLTTVFMEASFYIGAFTFLGAYLRSEFAISYTAIGALTALSALGAVLYSSAAPTLLARYTQATLFLGAALAFSASFLLLAVAPVIALVALAIVVGGGSFALFHNALQNLATQMNPEARGASIATFAFCFFAGQTVGVFASSFVYDHWGAAPLFVASGILLPALILWFRTRLAALRAA